MQWQIDTEISPNISRTSEGYLALRGVPVARTGTQLYAEHEVPGVRGNGSGMVSITRNASEVFAPASVASYVGKPVTLGHPYEAVTRDNWQHHAVGYVADPRRDGDLLRADLLVTRGDAIDAVLSGTRGISVGYDAVYHQQGPGQASQHGITCNHVAIVEEGRCGPRCTIGDQKMPDPLDKALNSHWANIETDDPDSKIGGQLVMRLPPPLSAYYLASDTDGNPALFKLPLPPLDPGTGSMGGDVPGRIAYGNLRGIARDHAFYAGVQRAANVARERDRTRDGAALKTINARHREFWK
jgi:hypothetical protein